VYIESSRIRCIAPTILKSASKNKNASSATIPTIEETIIKKFDFVHNLDLEDIKKIPTIPHRYPGNAE